jgi:hypothetical protein
MSMTRPAKPIRIPGMPSLRSFARIASVCLLPILADCGGVTSPEGEDSGTDAVSNHDVNVSDGVAESAVDATLETGSDSAVNPCSAGTCRLIGDPSGKCLPPGGPLSASDSGKLSGCCGCGSDGFCSSECVCASPDTPIATPKGDRTIASLSVGDLVLSIDHGRLEAVPIRETHRTHVSNHQVIEVVLGGGAILRISAAHPTADGRLFGQLQAGDWLGGREVLSTRVVPYAHDATYDILPESDTGTYFAGGALIGSTLSKKSVAPAPFVDACMIPSSISMR